jgi:hypothetical protein
LAALIQAGNVSLTPLEVKSIIEKSVDLDKNIINEVASGGRVNAYHAMMLLRALSLSANLQPDDSVQLNWSTSVPLNGLVTIQRREDGETDFSNIDQVNAATTSYSDDTISSSSVYYYRVQAKTVFEDSGYSNQAYAGDIAASNISSGSPSGGGGGGGGGCFVQTILGR